MQYSRRIEPYPKETRYGFKLMNVDKDGKPHAMFIDAAAPYEYQQWYDADRIVTDIKYYFANGEVR